MKIVLRCNFFLKKLLHCTHQNINEMVYSFVVISSEEENFVREFELHEENTLLDFHNCLQEELEYDSSQMASFFTANSKWEKEEEFTVFDMGTNNSVMEDVIIDDIVIDKNQKLLYIFDMFNERALFIECSGTIDEIDGREYPVCARSQGRPPKQLIITELTNKDYTIDDIDEDQLGIEDEPDLSEFENIGDIEDL